MRDRRQEKIKRPQSNRLIIPYSMRIVKNRRMALIYYQGITPDVAGSGSAALPSSRRRASARSSTHLRGCRLAA